MTRPDPDFGSRTDFYTFAPEALATALPDFEILREVGKGSMGIVYEARRRADGRRVALKVLPPSLTLTERALARFLREGEVMAKVRHDHIVRVYDLGSRDRLYYFVMEFVDGTNLDERLRVGPLPVRQAAELGAQIGHALHFAHERGVVHRDVKPGNLILRDDGRVVITDFGLARETGTGSMTESGAIVGTPMYMAPEQILGNRNELDARADVYGLGATLYTLLTGRPPFAGPTAQSVLKQVLDDEPPRPSRFRAELDAPLEAIVLMAMRKERTRRYGSARELAEDLERLLRGERVHARLPGPLARSWRVVQRRPLLAAMTAVAIALAAGALHFYREARRDRLEMDLAGAERSLALAAAEHDEHLRELTADDRRALLHDAVARASSVIAADARFTQAWYVRAKAKHRLRQYREALADLDAAEEQIGRPTAEILHYRIDALSHIDDDGARAALLDDLDRLLGVDRSTNTLSTVAGQLLRVAARDPVRRDELLGRANALLDEAGTADARALVARARYWELRERPFRAFDAIREALGRSPGDPIVRGEATALLTRLGQRAATDGADPSGFLEEVTALLDSLRRQP